MHYGAEVGKQLLYPQMGDPKKDAAGHSFEQRAGWSEMSALEVDK